MQVGPALVWWIAVGLPEVAGFALYMTVVRCMRVSVWLFVVAQWVLVRGGALCVHALWLISHTSVLGVQLMFFLIGTLFMCCTSHKAYIVACALSLCVGVALLTAWADTVVSCCFGLLQSACVVSVLVWETQPCSGLLRFMH